MTIENAAFGVVWCTVVLGAIVSSWAIVAGIVYFGIRVVLWL